MDIDPNKLIDKLKLMLADANLQIAVLQTATDQLRAENERLKNGNGETADGESR
ncbi:hypothetical protein KIH79_06695 [Bifidobacterium sp. 82T10]|uniref:Transposase n=1 Tax=Bifidobacterium miconis TaxID=2834435 RepID=A0ABS6WF06_9BIFI|nr:hypothetical protein [Bifidobacterium miconis]MBW3092638.1 hypothetical protein [Bifidobacterium miconis]